MFGPRITFNSFVLLRKIDKSSFILPIFISICLFALPAEAQYSGGTGDPNDPYQIWTAEQMNAIGTEPSDWDKHFKLMSDIDLAQYTSEQFNIIGYDRGFSERKPFTGVFDGNGKAISNFTYTSTDRDRIGLFGHVGKNGKNSVIKGLRLIDPNVDAGTGIFVGAMIGSTDNATIIDCCVEGGLILGERQVGGLIGNCYESTISNCYSNANVQGIYHVGGLVGESWKSMFFRCYSNVVVTGKRDVGGLIGKNGGKIEFCYSDGDICGEHKVGGLVGYNHATLSSCYSTATVAGTKENAGGLVGYNSGEIISCQASGNVEGNTSVGGLAGYNYYKRIIHCYATGAVHGDNTVAGFVGNNNGWISFSYSTGQVIGSEFVAGFTNGGSVYLCYWDIESSGIFEGDAGRGRTTAQMQSASTYPGWGYENQWKLDNRKDYPRLIWEDTVGELLIDEPRSYGGGTGGPNDPYRINTASQLTYVAYYPEVFDKYFILTNNIDFGTIDPNEIIPIGNHSFPFVGSLDGNGHTIFNFNCHEYGQYYIGLFGYIGQNGYVENIQLQNISVSGSSFIGGLAGQNLGVIHQCSVSGAVEGSNDVGGLTGRNEGTVTGCSASGLVVGSRYVGGLVGGALPYSSNITKCFTNSDVVGDSSVGGLVGCNWGDISVSYSTSSITGKLEVGGLVGFNRGPGIISGRAGPPPGAIPEAPRNCISSCYFNGSVEGHSSVGGLVGRNTGLIATSYSAGPVIGVTDIVDRRYWGGGIVEQEAIDIGGLVGSSEYGVSLLSYWDMEISGLSKSAEGKGKTTEQMMTTGTFRGWAYLDQWVILEKSDYPHLIWKGLPGEPLVADPDKYSGGNGQPDNPYRISSSNDLVDLSNHPVDWNRYFVMTNDIDLNDLDPNHIQPIGVYGVPFVGVFDGNDHKILNFKYLTNTESFVGIFGSIGSETQFSSADSVPQDLNGIVMNLNVENIKVSSYCCTGGLAGYNDGGVFNCSIKGEVTSVLKNAGGLLGYNAGEVTECKAECNIKSEHIVGGLIGHSTGPVTGCSFGGSVVGEGQSESSFIGGLIGDNYDAVESCHVIGAVTGGDHTGGLIGYNDGSIIDCSASGNVTGTQYVGGLVGLNRYFHSPIIRSFSDCIVTGEDTVGGLVGYNSGEISNCYTKGHVNGTKDIAGLVGRNYETIMFCYSSCSVNGQENTAGLVGESSWGDITSCFWDKDISGFIDGIANLDPDPEGAIALSTTQMLKEVTFLEAGWDFVNEKANGTEDIWWILEGQDYPRLWWEKEGN